ncbi:MAG: ATPase [Peptococcaceae bacterium]|jgi:Ca2+-transporting ATPase|nr:ATPase [Peptococcaceae bacterium]
MEKSNWHALGQEEVVLKLQTDREKGLEEKEAARRLELVGPNQLVQQKRISPVAIFLSQFRDFMVLVLIAATVISGLLGEYADAITIMAIVIINAILGFIQEFRAEKSMEALKKLIAPEATVKREGEILRIPASQLVPGDIVILDTGDIIPADLRIMEAHQLEVEEAALTGESVPVKKRPQEIYLADTPLGDRRNMGFMGTVVTRGKGWGIAVETGMSTEMGQIADYIQKAEEEDTPLQKRLAQLGRWLVLFCLAIVAVVVVTGVLRGEPVYRMFLTGVSLAVAAIPEGLPAIVTIALAVGVQKMVKRQAIVRKLPAVETLGCATVICSDKTGTLTQNEMTVRQIFSSGDFVHVTGEGYEPRGKFVYPEMDKWRKENKYGLEMAFKIAALCNNADLQKNDTVVQGLFRNKKQGTWKVLGDPTEGALLVAAAKAGIWRETLEKSERRVYEIPFDSERKRMSVVYLTKNGPLVYCKGAPDVILNLCTSAFWQGKIIPLTKELKEEILRANDRMAAQALRVLGLAFRDIPQKLNWEKDESRLEENLTFVALAGMIDPPRLSAKKAVKLCKTAGIKTVMITGDHKNTAEAVAKELGIIASSQQKVLAGPELDGLSDNQLLKEVNQIAVYARVSPKHKLRIVKALKGAGHIVAMTGDGVNDAPAVKEADIGVSMGITGTDVTKEASAMILGNDDFATIVAAVEEGRAIYDNIRKFIRYLLSCNVGEVLTMFFAALMGLPLPLIPIQILWMNLVTDGLPAMALGVDTSDPDIMTRKPRDPQESIFAHGLTRRILVRGTLITIITLITYIAGFYLGGKNLDLARTMAFSTLVFAQLFYVFDCRSERYSIFELGLFSNPYLVAAVTTSVLMQLAVIYIPFFQPIFKTVSLEAWHWILIIGLSGGTTLLQGLYRTVKIRRKRRIITLRA